MATIGAELEKYLAGQSNLPESAAGHKQKPVKDFGWKPTDKETQRDIERDKKYSPIERELFMEQYRKRIDQEGTRKPVVESKGPRIGIGLSRLLQDVKGAVKDTTERLGAEARKQIKSLANFPEIDMDNLPKGPIDPAKGAELATDLLQTTPAGAVAGTVKNVAKALERASWTEEQLDKWGGMGDDALSFMEYQLESSKRSAKIFAEAKSIVKRWEEEIKEFKSVNKIKDAIPDDWMGEKIASELGDVTITRSAKFPDKVQVTYWSGKAGTSPTVSDEIFDSVEEAKAAVKK